MLDRAVVAQRLHQGERHAAGDGRTGERQGDLGEAAPRPPAQGAADLDDADRLLEESGARQQVDVRVEHHGHDQDGAAQGVHLGEPVIAAAPAEEIAQARLHRPGEREQAAIGEGDGVGRHRQRQQQRPLEYGAAREAAHGHQPGGGNADQKRPGADAEHQHQGVDDVAGENRLGEMAPDLARRHEDAGHDHRDGHRDEPGDDQGRQGPPVDPQQRRRADRSGAGDCRGSLRQRSSILSDQGAAKRGLWQITRIIAKPPRRMALGRVMVLATRYSLIQLYI